jgi:hypothetical protein
VRPAARRLRFLFRYHLQIEGTAYGVAGGDALGVMRTATTAGLVLSAANFLPNGVIEIEDRDLEAAGKSFGHLRRSERA